MKSDIRIVLISALATMIVTFVVCLMFANRYEIVACCNSEGCYAYRLDKLTDETFYIEGAVARKVGIYRVYHHNRENYTGENL